MLNASRHQRNLHGYIPVPVESLDRCSTPHGIKGIFTNQSRWTTKGHNCAQRLTASKESSRRDGRPSSGREWVLNASRHQRNLHCWSARGVCSAASAQRLTASKESSLIAAIPSFDSDWVLNASRHQRNLHLRRHCRERCTQTCAQRLTASKESSLPSCRAKQY